MRICLGNTRTGKYMFGSGTKLGPLDVTQSGSTCYLENKNVKTVNLNHASSKAGNPAHSYVFNGLIIGKTKKGTAGKSAARRGRL